MFITVSGCVHKQTTGKEINMKYFYMVLGSLVTPFEGTFGWESDLKVGTHNLLPKNKEN